MGVLLCTQLILKKVQRRRDDDARRGRKIANRNLPRRPKRRAKDILGYRILLAGAIKGKSSRRIRARPLTEHPARHAQQQHSEKTYSVWEEDP